MITNSIQPHTLIPRLREDLKLYPGPTCSDGTPTWTLHDPICNRFFRLGWLDYSLFIHWKPQNVSLLIERVFQKTGLAITLDHVEQMAQFLSFNQLLSAHTKHAVQSLQVQHQKRQPRLARWLLHHYLFIKIPLIRPDGLLRFLLSWLGFVYTPTFVWLLALAGIMGGYLTIRQWDAFGSEVAYFFSMQGVLWYAVTLIFVKIIHELGHGVTACRFGCRVPSMGVAFMVLWPVLYTDTTEAWKLKDLSKRLAIGISGVGAEWVVAIVATLAWSFVPEGPARSSLVMLATVTWVTSLAINLSPFMRFDGYYLLSDLLGMDNLQERAFKLARWRLRLLLFGWADPPPEFFPTSTKRVLLLYAYSTWVYRLVLFVGIALMVYHWMFKLAGIFLMGVELVWFIGRPVWMELRVWWRMKDQRAWNPQSILSLLFGMVLFSLLLIPWQGHVHVPALLSSKHHLKLYAPLPSRVVQLSVSVNQKVIKGQTLLTLEAPDILQDMSRIDNRIQSLKWEMDHFMGRDQVLNNRSVMQKERVALLSKREGYEKRLDRLRITAPFSGVITHIEKGLLKGRWVTSTLSLIELVDGEKPLIEGFVSESDIQRIKPQTWGVFKANDWEMGSFRVCCIKFEPVSVPFLPNPYLVSSLGGDIAAWEDNQGRWVPFEGIYRLTLEGVDFSQSIDHIIPGKIRIPVEKKSIAQTVWTTIATVFIRESGF